VSAPATQELQRSKAHGKVTLCAPNVARPHARDARGSPSGSPARRGERLPGASPRVAPPHHENCWTSVD
jgi:hypothetical protein